MTILSTQDVNNRQIQTKCAELYIVGDKMKFFKDYYPISIPQGILFYPCTGLDIIEPIELFADTIREFHFADLIPFTLPSIPKESLLASSKIIKQGYLNPKLYQIIIDVNNKYLTINWHQTDAIKVLEKLNNISVFFYRGDSIAGSGSGIYWLGKELFSKILTKIVNGGLIITDGSNPDEDYKIHPWKELYLHSQLGHFSDNRIIKPNNFTYNNRCFTCLGPLGKRYGTVYAWKVEFSD